MSSGVRSRRLADLAIAGIVTRGRREREFQLPAFRPDDGRNVRARAETRNVRRRTDAQFVASLRDTRPKSKTAFLRGQGPSMAFKRSSRGTGGNSMGKRINSGRPGVKTLAKRAKRVEVKVHDVSQATLTAVDHNQTSSTGIALTNIAQGVTGVTRVGRNLQIKALQLRLRFVEAATPTTQFVRILIVQYKVPNADGQVLGDILAAPDDIMSFRDRDRARLLNVLYDKRFFVSDTGGLTVNNLDIVLKPANSIYFDDNLSTTDNYNGIVLYNLSDQSTEANRTLMAFQSRLLFTDA